MNKMTLSHMILPKVDKAAVRSLYIRGDAYMEEGQVQLGTDEVVSFDTYHNAFFYSKYLSYTEVKTVSAAIEVNGACRVELMRMDREGRTAVLEVRENIKDRITINFQDIALSSLTVGGMLYFRVTGLSNGATVCGGHWEGEIQEERRVSLAIVICTYKREAYVRRNIQLLRQTVLQDMEGVELFVIDNGRTLEKAEEGKVHILPNRNYGGSGGFTRGLIEACEKDFTHVLFMDDDIRFEAEVIYRTIQLLKVAKQGRRPLMIGGGMLTEDEPTIQFESGAFYRDGRLRPVGRGLDLSKTKALLENDEERHVQYNAWWYCCFPVSLADEIGLPLPFFIKSDDVEYGLRAKADILLLNGIGVWHTAFSGKYSPYLEYYIKRNELIVGVIHKNGDGVCQSLWKLIRGAGKACLMRNTDILDYLTLAYQDFLKGPDFFLCLDAEIYNEMLKTMTRIGQTSPGVLKSVLRVVCVGSQVVLHYQKVKREYAARWQELTTYKYWCRQLGYKIEGKNNNA